MSGILSNELSRRGNMLLGCCVFLCAGVVTVSCGGADLDVGDRGDQLEDEADSPNSPSEVADDASEAELPTPQPTAVSNTPTLDEPNPTDLQPSPVEPMTDANAPLETTPAPSGEPDVPLESTTPTPSADPNAPTLDSPTTTCVECTGEETDLSDCQPACPRPVVASGCGDGLLDGVEECDDGNLDDGDGCSASCQFEANDAPTLDTPVTVCVECTGEASDPPDCQPACPQPVVASGCGDGLLDGVEECDDGNLDDGDGCSASCQFE